jgi:hypothetical protein
MTEKALEFIKRPAKFINVNTRLEKHGDSEVLAADISIRGFHIDKDEYNFIKGNKHAWSFAFTEAKGKPAEPTFRNIAPTKILDTYEGCSATFGLGLTDNVVEFEDVRVSKIELEEQVGGLTLMDCLIQTEIEDTDDVAALLEYLNSEGTIAMFIGAKAAPKGKRKQQSLDLGPTPPPKGDEQQAPAHH